MKSLKITLAALTLTVFANFSMAQNETPSAQERANKQTEHLTEKLALTPEQKTQVGDINLAIIQKNDAVKSDQNMPEQTKKDSYKGNNDARSSMIKQVLTPEQVKKFEEMEAARSLKVERPNIQREMKPATAEPVKN